MLTKEQYQEIEQYLIQHGFDWEGNPSLEVGKFLIFLKQFVEGEGSGTTESGK